MANALLKTCFSLAVLGGALAPAAAPAQTPMQKAGPAATPAGPAPTPVAVPLDALRKYEGSYQMTPRPDAPAGMTMPPLRITAEAGGLIMTLRGPHRLLPISPNEFFDEQAPNMRHTFAPDGEGRMVMTVSGFGGPPMKAVRQP